ncbi:tRNA pseudouridine(13) synthase TruD, partial [Planctomicrobium sp.]|nr:tRNA pseudouridine(13) synthase TruD [Planctomicrobium sp.]
IPVYLPSGTGDHLFLWIEKRDVSAEQLLQHLSATLKIHRNEIGVAGLKDRRAITRQWVSVPAACLESVPSVNTERINVLDSQLHSNKLKTGHLKGNRFTIVLRTSDTNALSIAEQLREELLVTGFPNYFGDQRFGIDGETLKTGYQLLIGELTPKDIPWQRRKFLTRLSLSAVQSALFNKILSSRIQDQTFNRVQQGDVLQVVASGGPFVSEEPEVDQLRFDRHEVVTSGPMFGPKMKLPEYDQLNYELRFLSECQLSLEHFNQHKKLTSGTRRPLLLRLEEMKIEQTQDGLRFQFELPKGAYATTIFKEFLK